MSAINKLKERASALRKKMELIDNAIAAADTEINDILGTGVAPGPNAAEILGRKSAPKKRKAAKRAVKKPAAAPAVSVAKKVVTKKPARQPKVSPARPSGSARKPAGKLQTPVSAPVVQGKGGVDSDFDALA